MAPTAGYGWVRPRRWSGSGPRPSAGRGRCSGRSSRPRTRSRIRRCRAEPSSAAGRSAGSPTGCPRPGGRPRPRRPSHRACSRARRTGGIEPKSRRPMISSGRPASNAGRKAGISAGSCWPSASSVTTATAPSLEGVAEPGPERGALAGVRALDEGRSRRLPRPGRPCRRSNRHRRRRPAGDDGRPRRRPRCAALPGIPGSARGSSPRAVDSAERRLVAGVGPSRPSCSASEARTRHHRSCAA